MNKTNQTLWSLLLALLMLLSLFSGCSADQAPTEPEVTAEPTVPVSIQEEKELLADSWHNYLAASEAVSVQLNWVLDYTDAFARDNSWDSLLKARAACTTAKQYLYTFPSPEFTLSEEQVNALMDSGIEAEVVKAEYLAFPQSLQGDLETLESLDLILSSDILYSSVFSELDNWVQIHRNLLASTSDYLCATTNYLLNQLEMPDLWNEFPDNFPTIARSQSPWCEDEDLLMEAAMLALDEYEEQFVQLRGFAGVSNYILELTKEALETQNLEYLSREIHIIDNVPFYLPLPDWLPENAVCYYLTTNPETDGKDLIQPGQQLDQSPSTLYISSPGVAFETVGQYIHQLEYWGYEPYVAWADDARSTYQIFIMVDDASVLIRWTAEETLFYSTGSIACLVPELYLLAK